MSRLPSRTSAGRLGRSRVDIVAPNNTQADSGQMIPGWDVYIARGVPASFEIVSGGSTVRDQQIEEGVTTLFTLRFRTDVTVQHRLEFGGRMLGIVRVQDPDGHRRVIMIQCKEVV